MNAALAHPAGPPDFAPGPRGGVARWAEMALLFAGFPIAAWGAMELGWMGTDKLFVLLGSAVVVCVTLLLADRSFRPVAALALAEAREQAPRVLALWVVGFGAMVGLVYLIDPEHAWFLPRERTRLWAKIIVGYPIISVVPQSIIYRVFFYHRYKSILRGPEMDPHLPRDRRRERRLLSPLGWASALAFCLGHVIFANWLALGLTLAGGIIFTHTYERSRSLGLTIVEHALYGLGAFTVGLGGSLYLPRSGE
jgi:hypothetical protein